MNQAGSVRNRFDCFFISFFLRHKLPGRYLVCPVKFTLLQVFSPIFHWGAGSVFFEQPIEVQEANSEYVLSDFNLMFSIETEEDYGYFDIYMLPMRREGFDGSTMYITEVAYEFE